MGGRKSKYNTEEDSNIKDVWRVAVYIRLSVEDGDEIESNSVTNQRSFIKEFINKADDMVINDFYVDDGYSGTSFNRPDFNRMLQDIKNNNVNCIVVKDLSRLGRNYVEVGNYLEQIFPLYNIRFIAINDDVDSYKDPKSINNVVVPFKNLMNDEYARDISNKILSVLNAKKRNGEYMGAFALYGYVKDPKDKHKLIVDDEAAKVVKQIYELAVEGYGVNSITKYLNDMGILSPNKYKKEILKLNVRNGKETEYWNNFMVNRILKNEMYCGDMVQRKNKQVSYKIHKTINVPRENWIIVRNTHEAIIDKEMFDKVQDILFARDRRVDKTGKLSIFAGYLRCYDCKKTMTKVNYNYKKYEEETGKKLYRYYCKSYFRQSHKICTKHTIRSDKLEEMVLASLKMQISLIIDIEKTIKKLTNEKKFDYEKETLLKRSVDIEKEIQKNKKLKQNLYEDWKMEVITKDEYLEYAKDYDNKIENLMTNLENLTKQLEVIKNGTKKDKNKWIQEFKKRRNIKELTREVVEELIDVIYVHEGENITIVYKYEDEYKQALEFIEKNKENLEKLKKVV